MQEREVRRDNLMRRWTWFSPIFVAAFWGLWYLIFGSIPVLEKLIVFDNYYDFGFKLSRLWDILAAPPVTLLIIWLAYQYRYSYNLGNYSYKQGWKLGIFLTMLSSISAIFYVLVTGGGFITAMIVGIPCLLVLTILAIPCEYFSVNGLSGFARGIGFSLSIMICINYGLIIGLLASILLNALVLIPLLFTIITQTVITIYDHLPAKRQAYKMLRYFCGD